LFEAKFQLLSLPYRCSIRLHAVWPPLLSHWAEKEAENLPDTGPIFSVDIMFQIVGQVMKSLRDFIQRGFAATKKGYCCFF
jgi:hypothetical protein